MKSNTRRLTAIACAVISAVPRIASSAPGDVDTAFDTKVGGLNTMAVQPNGKLLVSDSYIAAGGGIVGRIARLNIDGTSDTDFIAHEFIADPTAVRNSGGYPIAVQADGKIVTVTTKNIARLYSNGTKDTSFNFNNNSARSGNYIDNISVQTDGKFVIGGNFTTVGGLTRNYVARVNANGTVDTGFNPNANESIFGTVAQPDGKLIIGGAFVKVGGVTRNRIARLSANGTLDTGFNPNVNERVWSMAVQADGKMVIGGEFTSVGGVTRNRIARINPDGTLDQGFHPNLSDKILTMAVQTDGKIIIGGLFRTVDGVVRNYILRLHPDGTLDRGFNPHATSTVHMLVVQADGKIVCNGTFSTVDGVTRTSIVRLDNDPATQSLTVVSPTRTQWLRGGSSPEVEQVSFELSTDGGSAWTPLGAGTRIAGGWELTGLSLPNAGHLRARGRTTGGWMNNSTGLVETVTTFPPERFRILSTVHTGGTLLFTFPTVDGQNYTLWRSDSLTDEWKDTGLTALPGNGANQVFTIVAPASGIPKRFYRVQSAP